MNTEKYNLGNKETLNELISNIFEVLERIIVLDQLERTYNNLSKSIPDSIELDKQLILTKKAECYLNDAKLDLLDLMKVVIETNKQEENKMTDKYELYRLDHKENIDTLIENLNELSRLLDEMNKANQYYLDFLNSAREPEYYELKDRQRKATGHTHNFLHQRQKILDLMQNTIENQVYKSENQH